MTRCFIEWHDWANPFFDYFACINCLSRIEDTTQFAYFLWIEPLYTYRACTYNTTNNALLRVGVTFPYLHFRLRSVLCIQCRLHLGWVSVAGPPGIRLPMLLRLEQLLRIPGAPLQPVHPQQQVQLGDMVEELGDPAEEGEAADQEQEEIEIDLKLKYLWDSEEEDAAEVGEEQAAPEQEEESSRNWRTKGTGSCSGRTAGTGGCDGGTAGTICSSGNGRTKGTSCRNGGTDT